MSNMHVHCGALSLHMGPGRWCARCGALHYYHGRQWVTPDPAHDARKNQPNGPFSMLVRERSNRQQDPAP